MRLDAALTVALHVVGKCGIEKHRHVSEQIMEDVWLDDVVELFRLSDPIGDRELAIREQCKKTAAQE